MSSGQELPPGWSQAPPLQLRTQRLGGGSFPTVPSTPPQMLFCKAGSPVAAQVPVLVGSPPTPIPALLCHVPWPLPNGASEWPFNPFTHQSPINPVPAQTRPLLGPSHTHSPYSTSPSRPHLFVPLLPTLSPVLLPLWLLTTHSLGSELLGSVGTWVPWRPGCHGTMGAGLADQQLWVTRTGEAQGPAPAALRL